MKMLRALSLLAFAALLGFVMSSCGDTCEQTITHTVYEPVYMSFAEMRAPGAIAAQASSGLKDPGKIYFKDQMLFVNERNKGVHIFDNSNPAAPRNVGFIAIPGNYDLAIRGNQLFADSYTDLVIINIEDVFNPRVEKRMENSLPYAQFVNGVQLDPSKGVVKEWVEKVVTETVPCNRGGLFGRNGRDNQTMDMASPAGPSFGGGNAGFSGKGGSELTNGVSGSMARFILVDQYLYTAANSVLSPYDLSDISNPIKQANINMSFEIETMFPYNGNLFLGSPSGMYIYSLSNPLAPSYVSMYEHMTGCDPVVVKGTTAYVTIRTGNTCNGWQNTLEVIDIANVNAPTMLASYSMVNPHGLGISSNSDNTLFVCDGDAGLKIFDATKPLEISQNLIKTYSEIHAYDVIPLKDNTLMMIGEDGLYQYDFSDVNNVKQLSVVPVEK